jgi:23S rRNA pseudouridine1911/1915/1917 synthase
MGCPIRGDVKYGFDVPNKDGNISLHARCLEFIHPVKGEPLTLYADLPDDGFWHFFKNFAKEKK